MYVLSAVNVVCVLQCIDWPSAYFNRSYIPEVRIMSIPNLRHMKVSVCSAIGNVAFTCFIHNIKNLNH